VANNTHAIDKRQKTKKYAAPRLRCFGSIKQLTTGGSTGGPEMQAECKLNQMTVCT